MIYLFNYSKWPDISQKTIARTILADETEMINLFVHNFTHATLRYFALLQTYRGIKTRVLHKQRLGEKQTDKRLDRQTHIVVKTFERRKQMNEM